MPTLLPSPAPTTAAERTQLVRAALQRQVDHIFQHARYQQWEPMLRSLDRFEALAHSSVPHDPIVEAFFHEELPRLQTLFAEIRRDLDAERKQLFLGARRLGQTRQLRQARQFTPTAPRLLASA